MISGFKAMKDLNKVQRPMFSVTPELQKSYDRAESMSNKGFTGAESGAMFARQAGAQTQQMRTGLARTGGNMAGVLGALTMSNQNDFNLGFGKADAGLRRQNIQYADQMGARVSEVKMLNQRRAI